MTEEEFKKSMTKLIIFIIIMIVLLIGLTIFMFNDSQKSTTIFESDAQKSSYESKVTEINESDISGEEVEQIDGSQEFITKGNEVVTHEEVNIQVQ